MSKLDTLTESEKLFLLYQLARREPRNQEERLLKEELLAQKATWKQSGSPKTTY